MSRRAAKRDGNHADIVKGLRAAGYSVADTGGVGDGFTDIVVGGHNMNYLLEIKDENQPPSARELTPKQKKFHATWRGQKAVVNNLAEALAACAPRSR